MITIYDEQDAHKLHDTELRTLVDAHLITARENGLEKLTCIAVVELADSEQTIIDELGFSPLQNPLTETRFGDPNFFPPWDWLELHRGWYEMIFTVGNAGFAFLVFVPRHGSDFSIVLAKHVD